MAYTYGASSRADEIRKLAAAKRAEAAAIREALEDNMAATQELKLAQKSQARIPKEDLATVVQRTIEWVDKNLPKPVYGGAYGLALAAREAGEWHTPKGAAA